MQQFPLNISLKESPKLEGFFPGKNNQLLNAVQQSAEGGGEPLLFLWGDRGMGKTHLLQGAARVADESGVSVAYIPLKMASALDHTLLANMAQMKLICVDDIHAIAGLPAWEEALFHLFNQARERDASLLVSAIHSPANLPITLPDLTSRLSWGTSYQLVALNDSEKKSFLMAHASDLGMTLNAEVADYILKQVPRDIPSLCQFIEMLDRSSLAKKRKPTVPFVRELLLQSTHWEPKKTS